MPSKLFVSRGMWRGGSRAGAGGARHPHGLVVWSKGNPSAHRRDRAGVLAAPAERARECEVRRAARLQLDDEAVQLLRLPEPAAAQHTCLAGLICCLICSTRA